jgi:DNA-binding SARP family transcriptional activator
MQTEVARLEQLRLAVLTDYYDTQISGGRHADIIPELMRLVFLYPHQETFRAHLMLAMWRSGLRQKALEAYLDLYRLMTGELGSSPRGGCSYCTRRSCPTTPSSNGGLLDEHRCELQVDILFRIARGD